MADQTDQTDAPTRAAGKITRRGRKVILSFQRDREFRTVRRALRRLGLDVTNLDNYTLRAEFPTAQRARALLRFAQTFAALGAESPEETAFPHAPPEEPETVEKTPPR